MDRRRFLLKAGQLSAACTMADLTSAPAMDKSITAKRAPRNGSLTLANVEIAWNLEWSEGKLFSRSFENKLSGHSTELASVQELVLTFSTADQRIEIPWWKFQFSPDATAVPPAQEQGLKLGCHRRDYDDKAWAFTENLLLKRLTGPKQPHQDDIRFDGYGWFRRWIDLPREGRGRELHLVLGGYDQQDWNEYWVYVNDVEVGYRSGQGRWREPGNFKIASGDAAYDSLRFGSGEQNLLAVRTRGFDKRHNGLSEEVLRRYVFEPFWVDQFATLGPPYLRVEDFEVKTVASNSTQAIFQLASAAAGIQASLHYELDGPTRRKWAEITNASGRELLLLDAQLDDFTTQALTSEGGAGEPVFLADEAFAALEHPAGLNQGMSGRVRLIHFPGRKLPAGDTTQTYTALVTAARPGEALDEFCNYVQTRSPRKQQPVSLYTPYGINNPSGACPALSEAETLNILDTVEQWQKKGIKFDYFTLDQGWLDPASDLTGFAPQCYPEGPGKIIERVKSLGMKFGLWFSITGAPWSCPEYSAADPSFIPPPGDPDLGHHPKEEFLTGYGMTHGRFCVASEPYFSLLHNALVHHMKVNDLKLFKIDMGNYYCNSSEHGHLPGKYSVEAMYQHLLELAAAAREADPDVYVMWYWGVRSPFFALHGGSVFESGLFMEGSGTSWFPTLYYRDSVTVNLDQGTQFAKTTPPINKDSLGVWLADIRWGNFMGSERWKEALVMDLGRGSLIFPQLWGDIHLLEDHDVEFLSRMNALAREYAPLFLHRRNVLGDPWKNQVYGYANALGARGFIFMNNAHFASRSAELHLGAALGLDAAHGTPVQIVSRFPEWKRIAPADGMSFKIGDVVKIWLRPFEVLMLEVAPPSDAASDLPPRSLREPEIETAGRALTLAPQSTADWMDVHFVNAARLKEKGLKKRVQAWTIDIPELEHGPHILAIPIKLRKDGAEWRYAPTVVEIVQLAARIGDYPIQMIPAPDARQFGNTQNAGCSWVVYKFPLGAHWAGKELQLAVAAYLPEGVRASVEGWVVRQWWEEPARPLGDGYYADEP